MHYSNRTARRERVDATSACCHRAARCRRECYYIIIYCYYIDYTFTFVYNFFQIRGGEGQSRAGYVGQEWDAEYDGEYKNKYERFDAQTEGASARRRNLDRYGRAGSTSSAPRL